jgi:hypothetical protein
MNPLDEIDKQADVIRRAADMMCMAGLFPSVGGTDYPNKLSSEVLARRGNLWVRERREDLITESYTVMFDFHSRSISVRKDGASGQYTEQLRAGHVRFAVHDTAIYSKGNDEALRHMVHEAHRLIREES